jgi:hypothetical protein
MSEMLAGHTNQINCHKLQTGYILQSTLGSHVPPEDDEHGGVPGQVR